MIHERLLHFSVTKDVYKKEANIEKLQREFGKKTNCYNLVKKSVNFKNLNLGLQYDVPPLIL